MTRQARREFSSPLPSEGLAAHYRDVSPSAKRFLHSLSECIDHVVCPDNSVRDRLWGLPTCDIQDQSRWTIYREDQGGMPLRPPPPWQIGNDRVVGVEACEVIDLGVLVLGRPTPRPCDEAGETAMGRRSKGGCLPCLVLAAFDDHRDAFCGLTRKR